jgi:hypothetical protein
VRRACDPPSAAALRLIIGTRLAHEELAAVHEGRANMQATLLVEAIAACGKNDPDRIAGRVVQLSLLTLIYQSFDLDCCHRTRPT